MLLFCLSCEGIPEAPLGALHGGLINANEQSSQWQLQEWYRRKGNDKLVLYDINTATESVVMCLGRGSETLTRGFYLPEGDFDNLNKLNAYRPLYWQLKDSIRIFNLKNKIIPLKTYHLENIDNTKLELSRWNEFREGKEYFVFLRNASSDCFGVK